jgi:hypothetical protein
VIGLLSPELQGRVIYAKDGPWINKVSFLRDSSMTFIVDVMQKIQSELFAAKERIHQPRTLFVVESGMAWRKGNCLARMAVWGEDLVLANAELRDETPVHCLTFLEAHCLHIDALSEVVFRRPAEITRIRKHVLWLALKRGLQMVARAHRKLRKLQAQAAGVELASPTSPISRMAAVLTGGPS